MNPSQYHIERQTYEDEPEEDLPVAIHTQYGGTYEGPLSIEREEADYDIRMGQQKAQEVFEQRQQEAE